jgi:hypothetical protein
LGVRRQRRGDRGKTKDEGEREDSHGDLPD